MPFQPRQLSDYDFDLPTGLIAVDPLQERSASRMMLVERASETLEDKSFADVVNCLTKDDVLVLNDTKVFPARLYGNTPTGAGIEVFLIRELDGNKWEALARPARRLRTGSVVNFGPELAGTVSEKLEGGRLVVEFTAEEDIDDVIDRLGKTPLPPYIKRSKDSPDPDRERYQTVYASKRGAIAAPTAGLHFTREILNELQQRGVQAVNVTLHVGYGTFEPVRVSNVADHTVAPEHYEITESSAGVINAAISEGRRIVAVGTTTARTLESNFRANGKIAAGKGVADLTILPGYEFKVVGGLLTNFHLPQSSLLILTSTFTGHDLIMKAYQHAIDEKYRFYSYGDCMLIV